MVIHKAVGLCVCAVSLPRFSPARVLRGTGTCLVAAAQQLYFQCSLDQRSRTRVAGTDACAEEDLAYQLQCSDRRSRAELLAGKKYAASIILVIPWGSNCDRKAVQPPRSSVSKRLKSKSAAVNGRLARHSPLFAQHPFRPCNSRWRNTKDAVILSAHLLY